MTERRRSVTSLMIGGVVAAICLLSTAAEARGDGEKVYKAKCASCRGPDGAGATPAGKAIKARDFCSDEVKKETDHEWTTIIVKGKNKMPAYDGKLTKEQIGELIGYIRELGKKH